MRNCYEKSPQITQIDTDRKRVRQVLYEKIFKQGGFTMKYYDKKEKELIESVES
jgi:hypothetical protein